MLLSAHSTPFHLQNTDYFCGPACAQMVLASIDPGLLAVAQSTLYTHTSQTQFLDTDADVGWASFPDGLVNALNAESGEALPFALYVCQREADLAQVLSGITRDHGRPSIVLTLGEAHWVVLTGIDVEPAPAGGQATPTGYYVHDPLPHYRDETLSHEPDDPCGTGIPPGAPKGFGTPNIHISALAWRTIYVTGVTAASKWKDSFLAVCLTDEVTKDGEFHQIEDSRYVTAPAASLPDDHSRQPGGAILSPDEVLDLARQLPSFGFPDHGPWLEALTESEPLTPLLVNQPNYAEGRYYIAPFGQKAELMQAEGRGPSERRVPLAVLFDAVTGDYQESAAVPGGTVYQIGWVDPETVNRTNAARDRRVRMTEQPGQMLQAELVWQPSEQSLSRFFPFFVSEDEPTRYYRIDGEEADALTPARA